jgi:hypothetical protein
MERWMLVSAAVVTVVLALAALLAVGAMVVESRREVRTLPRRKPPQPVDPAIIEQLRKRAREAQRGREWSLRVQRD